MKKLLGALAFLLALGTALPLQAAESDYAKLLAVLKSGNTRIDYQQLRYDFMESPEYKLAKDTTKAEDAMNAAMNAKDFAKAIKSAEEVLGNEYVNIDAHYSAYIANRELGQTDKAEFHRSIFRGLVQSILASGDGLKTDSAWVVITVHEEYVVLSVLGMRPGSQAVIHKDGHSYDEMKVKDADGKDHTFYFNVDIPFKHYM